MRAYAREAQVELERLGLLPHLLELGVEDRHRSDRRLERGRSDDVGVRDRAPVEGQLQLGAGPDERRILETGHLG